MEGKEAVYDTVFDDEHEDDMYLDLDADAKHMSVEEQQRIEEIHAINKVEAKSRLEIKCVSSTPTLFKLISQICVNLCRHICNTDNE